MISFLYILLSLLAIFRPVAGPLWHAYAIYDGLQHPETWLPSWNPGYGHYLLALAVVLPVLGVLLWRSLYRVAEKLRRLSMP
jgi:hypothetical protein